MTVFDYTIEWHEPFRFYGTQRSMLFNQPEVKQPGICLWTIPFKGQHLTYYVGETGRSFAVRHTEHAQSYLHGLYRVYDPEQFAQGEKVGSFQELDTRYNPKRANEASITFATQGSETILGLTDTVKVC